MSIFTRSQHMGAAALLLGISVFLSRFMGLIRDKVISYYYGAGTEADIYLASFVAPDFINYLLAGGYFSITLIPLLARKFKESDDAGWKFFSTVFWWICMASFVCIALAWVYAPAIAKITAPGFIQTPEHLERLIFFLRIVLPAQIFFLPGACLTALLYWRRQFTSPALMPLIYNGGIILGGLAMTYIAPERGMEGFCWGVIAGSFLGAFALPLLVARSGGLHIRFHLKDKGMLAFVLMALPLMLGQSIAVLDEQFIRVFGSLAGVGGVALLAYARRFMFVPIGVVAQAAGAASYPFLATLAAEGKESEFAATVNNVQEKALAVAVPLCVWMAAIAEPLIRLLFEQGRFTRADTETCALLLALMLPGVLFWVVHQLVSRSFYAHEDTLTPAVVGTVTTVLFLPVYYLLTKALGAPGVAVAGVLGIGAYTAAMVKVWHKRRGAAAFSGLVPYTLQAVCIAAFPGFAAWLAGVGTATLLPSAPLLGAAVALAAASAVFAAAYLPLAGRFAPHLVEPIREIRRAIQRKRQ
ncbi:Integral membrane protein MviN [uncultured delta proteobacterium]|uniref:Integral membrane protein MviN n=1 Tax=uncultured delta proteobacterium TaxID=34034 RepID=A0A212J994_9DELT|nr:Integral membrane protein MviN [uncultured delta proteobacterium]